MRSLNKICCIGAYALAACSGRELRFEGDPVVQVSLVPFDDPSSAAIIGHLPLSVSANELSTTFLRFDAPGRVPETWIVRGTTSDRLKIRLALDALPPDIDSQVKKATREKAKAAQAADVAAQQAASKAAVAAATKPQGPNGQFDNLTHRLLMESYSALSERDFAAAKKLAQRVAVLAPKIAAPYILTGIATAEEGDKGKALALFRQARVLDRDDKDIDALIKSVQ